MRPQASSPTVAIARKRGIFYGWWIVLSGFLANFGYAEQFSTSYAVFIHSLSTEMGWGRTSLAGVQTASRLSEAVLASLLGPLVDRHGTRWLMTLGGVVVGGSFVALSAIDHLWQIYLLKGVVMSLGAICLGGFISVTVANWFVAHRGRALGIIHMGSFLGASVMPLAAAFIIAAWGWRQAWSTMGVLVLVVTLPAAIFVRRRPEDLGMHPDGVSPGEGRVGLASGPERRRQEMLLAADLVWTRREALRTPVLWTTIFAWGLSSLAISATNLHLVPFMQELGYPLVIAAAAVSLRAACALIGSPLWGLLAERLPINRVASAQFGCEAIAMLAFLAFPTPVGLIAGLIVYGFGVGGTVVVLDTLWANYFGRTSLGLVRSIAFPLQLGFGASGPLVVGLLFDLSGSYQLAWVVLLCGFLLAGALIQFARPPRRPSPPTGKG